MKVTNSHPDKNKINIQTLRLKPHNFYTPSRSCSVRRMPGRRL